MLSNIVWENLSPKEQTLILERPKISTNPEFEQQLMTIINNVKFNGDQAIYGYTKQFDQISLSQFKITKKEIKASIKQVNEDNARAIRFAFRQIYDFHSSVYREQQTTTISQGIVCMRQARAIEVVGLYVPGGLTPLPSTVLMLGVPSLIAGSYKRIICTPPKSDGSIDPNIVYAADLCGIDEIYKIGGAQAIAAMAYGTETIPKVQKIFGPGNAWVTAAKIAVMQDPQGASCDLPAGPSELMIIGDDSANPSFIAADLLSQAEHGADAQVILITNCAMLAEQVGENIQSQLRELARKKVIMQSLEFGKIIVVDKLETAFEISNAYAPEHLSIQVRKPKSWLKSIKNAGAVFLGTWTAQTLGDYVIGTNHVLPTEGYSKVMSGLSVQDFLKIINITSVTKTGCKQISPYAITLAKLEGLDAHANAVTQRLRMLV